jgi:hypothetical protein
MDSEVRQGRENLVSPTNAERTLRRFPADAAMGEEDKPDRHHDDRGNNGGGLRKAVKTKGSFPSEDAARKLIYLAIQNAAPQRTRTRGWTKALLAFKIQFGDQPPD